MSYLRSVIQISFLTKKSYTSLENVLNKVQGCSSPFADKIQKRYSRYKTSNDVEDPRKYTNFEVTNNPEEWKFVERLLPKITIPVPTPKKEYPSGWIPQKANAYGNRYFIERNKNHMMPVYLRIRARGQSKSTLVRRIEGDIWALNKDLTEHLKTVENKPIGSQVDEVSGTIRFKGDHVYYVNKFLLSKGF